MRRFSRMATRVTTAPSSRRSSNDGAAARPVDRMSYEILMEEREPIDGWTVCTVCLSIERTTKVYRGKWRCPDCGVDTSNNSQRTVKEYLVENYPETIEKNL